MQIQFDTRETITSDQAKAVGQLLMAMVEGTPVAVAPELPPVAEAPKVEAEKVEAPKVEAEKPKAAPKKRKRRTKAQIEADKKAEAAKILAENEPAEAASPSPVDASPAAPPVAADDSPSESATLATVALSAGDMKQIVLDAVARMQAKGDVAEPLRAVVDALVEVTGKKRISEIPESEYPKVADHLAKLGKTEAADGEIPDPFGF